MTVAFFWRFVTPHQSITVMPMVSSEPVSTTTLHSRPLNSSGLSSQAITQGSCRGPPSLPYFSSSKRSKNSSIWAVATPTLLAIRALGSKVGVATAQMLEFFERFDEEKYGSDGGPLHDPCVIAWLLKPELFRGRECNVVVETGSELTMGMTVIDWWGVTKRPKNATVMRDVDDEGFFALLVDRLGRF